MQITWIDRKRQKADLVERIKAHRAATEVAEKSQVAATPVEENEEDGPLEDWTVKELKD